MSESEISTSIFIEIKVTNINPNIYYTRVGNIIGTTLIA